VLFDREGLLAVQRRDLANFQTPFAIDHPPVQNFADAVRALRPTGIIGVSTVPKLFNRDVISAMAEINQRPIVFPYSNPTSRSECTAEEAYQWSDGRAIFASGSPFPPVSYGGRTFVPGQGNNVYIFPAMGMAVFATQARRVTDPMFIIAAEAVATEVPQESLDTGLIYPQQSRILEASLNVAARIAAYIFDADLARVEQPKDIRAFIASVAYKASYRD
jgi:malate dehydrogenase (oxaloacetate-decarboxylating)(NADP+)